MTNLNLTALSQADKLVEKYHSELRATADDQKRVYQLDTPEKIQTMLNEMRNSNRLLRIGIIGRVKAGKSSLLNALLFNGKNVLPKAATPMTAALTIMRHSTNDQATAELDFYLPEDIAEIKRHYDTFQTTLASTTQKITTELQQQKRNITKSPAEIQEQAHKRALRELTNSPYQAGYEQYCRMQESGLLGKDLTQYTHLTAPTIEALQAKLQDFVGANGRYMPFTKSVTLNINAPGIEGLEVIDTPGINDPVQSRGVRTENLLKECEVVLVVSPAGQFLSQEDIDLMNRVTTKQGIQEVYLIASQVDNQLFGSLNKGTPENTLHIIAQELKHHATDVLTQQSEQNPAMAAVLKKFAENDIIPTSGVAYSLRHTAQTEWDSNAQHVFHNLKNTFPDAFSNQQTAHYQLDKLANIERIRQIITHVQQEKDAIHVKNIEEKQAVIARNIDNYLQTLSTFIAKELHDIQTQDIDTLIKQQEAIKDKTYDITTGVEDIIDESKLRIDDIKTQLENRLNQVIRQFENAKDDAETTIARTGTRKKSGFWNTVASWFGGGTEEYTYYEEAIDASTLRRTLENITDDIGDTLAEPVPQLNLKWRQNLQNALTNKIRSILGDENTDVRMIDKAVRQAEKHIQPPDFESHRSLPSELQKSGKLSGWAKDEFLDGARDYINNLKRDYKDIINEYCQTFSKRFDNANLEKTFTEGLNEEYRHNIERIQDRELNIAKYKKIQHELNSIIGSAE